MATITPIARNVRGHNLKSEDIAMHSERLSYIETTIINPGQEIQRRLDCSLSEAVEILKCEKLERIARSLSEIETGLYYSRSRAA